MIYIVYLFSWECVYVGEICDNHPEFYSNTKFLIVETLVLLGPAIPQVPFIVLTGGMTMRRKSLFGWLELE